MKSFTKVKLIDLSLSQDKFIFYKDLLELLLISILSIFLHISTYIRYFRSSISKSPNVSLTKLIKSALSILFDS
jgi:hypothetical protein